MANVMVGCKLPHGLIMELIKPGVSLHPQPTDKRVTLKGANSVRVGSVNPKLGEYGLTAVDAEFAAEWFKVNAGHPAVKNGFVFVEKTKESAEAVAAERLKERTGLEPLDPDKPPKDIQADPDHMKRLRKAVGA